MSKENSRYRIVPDRTPRVADARLFRTYWHRQRKFHRPSRKFMRDLAHDYWRARNAESRRLEAAD